MKTQKLIVVMAILSAFSSIASADVAQRSMWLWSEATAMLDDSVLQDQVIDFAT